MQLRLLFVSILTVIVSGLSYAQTLSGKVTDVNNAPVTGASVKVANTNIGTSTNVEGRFTLKLAEGKTYTIELSSIGYAPKLISDVELNKGADELNIILEPQARAIEGVVVKATSRRQENTTALLTFQKNNTAVSSVIAADFIKRTPDKNTGEVLKRVSGASIQDNKYVIIRGLADRYNSAYINGAQLPSSEPDKKAFSFDVIPSQLIDNIIINKTATPDLTGEFAGGLVQVTTKDIPTKNSLSIGASLGYNTQSTFKDFTSNKRGKTDWLGFSDRAISPLYPKQYGAYGALSTEKKVEVAKSFRDDVYQEEQSTAGPIQQYNLTWANVIKGENNSSFGSTIGLTYRKAKLLYTATKYFEDAFDYTDLQNKYSVNWGAVANLAWTKGKHKIAFKNLFNQLFDDNYYTRTGIVENTQELSLRSSIPNQRSLYSGQLEGAHALFSDWKFNWNINYSYNNKQQPDLRVISYLRTADSDEQFSLNSRGNNTSRFYSDLSDNAYGYNASLLVPFNRWNLKQSLKIGGSSTVRFRDFQAILLGINSPTDASLNQLPYDRIFNKENFRTDGFYFNTDVQNSTDKYYAISTLNAGYLMLDNKLSDKIRLVWGGRFENFEQFLKTKDERRTGDKAVLLESKKLDVLPSFNLTYSPNTKTNLRFSGSKTVARPEFREVARFSFYDFEQLASLVGNDTLKRTGILNGDIRYEYYPKSGELLSLGLFYKDFKDPIEVVLTSNSIPTRREYIYQNAKQARLFGMEAEFRKSLNFISYGWMENLYFNGNVSVIFSKVTLNQTASNGSNISTNRPLQGQSPYLINAGFQYDGEKGTNFSLLYNRIGQRLALVGNESIHDFYEKPRDLIDFQISQKIFKNNGELKLTVSDILNQKVVVYQNANTTRAYNKGTDPVFSSYTPGSTFSLGLTYNLDLKK